MKKKIQEILSKNNKTVGCWNMEILPTNLQKQFIDQFEMEYPYIEDFNVVLGNLFIGKYVVEVYTVDDEVDFNCITYKQYYLQYGEYPDM